MSKQSKKNGRKKIYGDAKTPASADTALNGAVPESAAAPEGTAEAETLGRRLKRLLRDPVFVIFIAVAALTALYDLAFAIVAAVFFGSASAGFLPGNFMPLAIAAVAVNLFTLVFALLYPKIRLR